MNDLPALLSDVGDATFATDPNYRILYWNRTAEEILGFQRDQVVGKLCYQVLRGIDPGGHQICHNACETMRQIQSGNRVPSCDIVVHTSDGEERCINTSTIVVRGNQARPIAIVHTFRDVTRHRQLELLGEQVLSNVGQFLNLNSPRIPMAPAGIDCQLTAREREVLELLAKGADSSRVAEELCISHCTARNHIQSILSKMGVHNKVEAVVQAMRYNLV